MPHCLSHEISTFEEATQDVFDTKLNRSAQVVRTLAFKLPRLTYIDCPECLHRLLLLAIISMTMMNFDASFCQRQYSFAGNEMAGCYSGSVATAPATATTPTVSVSSIGAPAPRPAGAIRTVTRNTYTCQNGECLRLNPKFSTTSPAYGGWGQVVICDASCQAMASFEDTNCKHQPDLCKSVVKVGRSSSSGLVYVSFLSIFVFAVFKLTRQKWPVLKKEKQVRDIDQHCGVSQAWLLKQWWNKHTQCSWLHVQMKYI